MILLFIVNCEVNVLYFMFYCGRILYLNFRFCVSEYISLVVLVRVRIIVDYIKWFGFFSG